MDILINNAGVSQLSYTATEDLSKAGVILLTKSLALEWARYHIRVNAVAPHYLETPLTEGLRATDNKNLGS